MIWFLFLAFAHADTELFDAAAVQRARAAGKPLFSLEAARVIPAHHSTPGEVEIHNFEHDIMIIQEGEAEIVVGGRAEGMKPIADGELRGKEIIGGKSYDVKKGDILVIAAKEPHWFKSIKKPVDYIVIKQKEKRRALTSRAFLSN